MKNLIIQFLGMILLGCTNPNYINYPLIFQFQSDVQDISISNLKIALSLEKRTERILIDSSDFFTCPLGNDTCDRRIFYGEIPNYTQNVPMTSHTSEKFILHESDGAVEMNIALLNNRDTLMDESLSLDPIKKYSFFLIYIGKSYSENISSIQNFIACLQDARDKAAHYSFPITGTAEKNDSLFLIWME